jgi:hypothetical protein
MVLSTKQTIPPSFEQKITREPSGEMELSAKQTIPPSFEQKLPGEPSGEMKLSAKQTIPPSFEQKITRGTIRRDGIVYQSDHSSFI